MGGHPVTPRILAALDDKFVGKLVKVEQLQASTGLDRKQIRSAMGRLVADEGIDCVVVVRGNAWQYNGPATASEPELVDIFFERVGSTKDGDLIARGTNTDRIYRFSRL